MEKNFIDTIDPSGKSALEIDSTRSIIDHDDAFKQNFEPISLKKFKDFNIALKKIYLLPGIGAKEEYEHVCNHYVSEMQKHQLIYATDFDEGLLNISVKPQIYNRVEIKDRSENFQYEVSEKYDSYINAQYIYNMYYKEPQNKPIFIATQGPIKRSFGHFWRMIWQENTRIIVMLCEKILGQCVNDYRYYFPENEEKLYYSDLIIEFISLDNSNSFVNKRIQKITNKVTKEERIVYHYGTDNWPDMGVPSTRSFDGFKNMIENIIQLRDANEEEFGPEVKSPIVVHCRAGVGRTGTFIAICELVRLIKTYQKHFKPLSKIEETNLGINIIGTFRCLREQRLHMIEKGQQYSYIYQFIKNYIDEIYE